MTEREALKLAQEVIQMLGAPSPLHFSKDEIIKWQECNASIATALAQPEQEPVAHLWECLGRWSAYLVNNGTQAECAPPSWLVDAIKKATTPPQRTWVGLTDEDLRELGFTTRPRWWPTLEAKLKEKNT